EAGPPLGGGVLRSRLGRRLPLAATDVVPVAVLPRDARRRAGAGRRVAAPDAVPGAIAAPRRRPFPSLTPARHRRRRSRRARRPLAVACPLLGAVLRRDRAHADPHVAWRARSAGAHLLLAALHCLATVRAPSHRDTPSQH